MGKRFVDICVLNNHYLDLFSGADAEEPVQWVFYIYLFISFFPKWLSLKGKKIQQPSQIQHIAGESK